MKNALRFSIVLGLITIAAGLGVSAVYQMTRGRIEAKKADTFAQALLSIFPEADGFRTLEGDEDWTGEGVGVALSGGERAGYLAVGARQGYSSSIRVLVGAGPDLVIRAVTILEQSETPGLGERTREVRTERTIWRAAAEAVGFKEPGESEDTVPWFQKQFAGMTLERLVVVKDPSADGIHAITGATVTSEAVSEAVRDALERIGSALALSGGAGGS